MMQTTQDKLTQPEAEEIAGIKAELGPLQTELQAQEKKAKALRAKAEAIRSEAKKRHSTTSHSDLAEMTRQLRGAFYLQALNEIQSGTGLLLPEERPVMDDIQAQIEQLSQSETRAKVARLEARVAELEGRPAERERRREELRPIVDLVGMALSHYTEFADYLEEIELVITNATLKYKENFDTYLLAKEAEGRAHKLIKDTEGIEAPQVLSIDSKCLPNSPGDGIQQICKVAWSKAQGHVHRDQSPAELLRLKIDRLSRPVV